MIQLLFSQVADLMNGKSQDIYKMPVPTPCSLNTPEHPVSLRIPSPLPSTEKALDINMSRSNAPGVPTLLYNHMDRWKKIRQRWKESSHRNQHRYTESMKILKEMFERHCLHLYACVYVWMHWSGWLLAV
ncbi:hypothetical protein scyTo_0022251 [Scyliorhinus torazame]|uniref:Uncharacterized protein n=1 Tax=Scyliorhinus torazame TaxID=75743 RepID=A0A401Q945_SCYTO|nr:hypothetical protein [Scyliorhinus torazame]